MNDTHGHAHVSFRPQPVEAGGNLRDKGPEEASSKETLMADATTAAAEAKVTKAGFIRSLPSDVPTESVIEQGSKVGLEISTSQVRQVRSIMRGGKKSKKSKAKKSKAEIDAIRKAAGRKAAETKARQSGKPPKKTRSKRKAPLFTAADGVMKTPALVKKTNQIAEEALIIGILQLGTRRVREILEKVEKLSAQAL